MDSFETEICEPDRAALQRAAKMLRGGELVAFPTETVYGLGGDATSDPAVAAIFAAKERPSFNPLIAHYAQIGEAARDVSFDSRAERLAAVFWPGPLTLVLPRRETCRVSLLCSAGLDSQAVRIPDHPVSRALLDAAGVPLAAPSANLAGKVSPTRAEHVASSLGGRIRLVLDGGPCRIGLESTVIDLTGPRALLLRPGAVTAEALESELGLLDTPEAAAAPRSPGMLLSHYAPGHPLRLDARSVSSDEALLAFGDELPTGAAITLNLSPDGDLEEAAAHLFAYLRALDEAPIQAIAVMPIPNRGLGRAINDRLRRAAAPRE